MDFDGERHLLGVFHRLAELLLETLDALVDFLLLRVFRWLYRVVGP